MGDELTVKLGSEVKGEIERMAKQAGLTPSKLVAVLLEGFVQGEGKVFTGPWKEGPGIRILPDWPRFSSKVFKIKQEEMK
ncbi:MAG: hypothetical protein HYX82_00070 [Chloroflexi bacterium]|nr:hypothetical protein [Chloroflexota bacterium]